MLATTRPPPMHAHNHMDASYQLARSEEADMGAWRAMRGKTAAWDPPTPPFITLTAPAKRSILQLVHDYRGLSSRLRKQAFGRLVQPPLLQWLKQHPASSAGLHSTRREVRLGERLEALRLSSLTRKVLLPRRYRAAEAVFQPVDPSTYAPLCICCARPCPFTGAQCFS